MPVNDAQELSVVVPVYNGAHTLGPCLHALLNASGPSPEIIVIDDGSTDNSAEIARRAGARVIEQETNLGQGSARNAGVKLARGNIVVFVDADVVIHADALERIGQFFREQPDYAAVFGSYDTVPAVRTLVSQYRNLLHHFVHQQGDREAETFWTGLGAVRREAFEAVGGFADNYTPIEDVNLGLRMHDAGYRIALEPQVMGTHLKDWTLRSMIATDIFDRALPWARMAFLRGEMTSQLNTSYRQRIAVACTVLGFVCLAASLLLPWLLLPASVLFAAVIILNAALFRFFIEQRSLGFAAVAAPLQIIHYLSGSAGFALGCLEVVSGRAITIKSRQSQSSPARRLHKKA